MAFTDQEIRFEFLRTCNNPGAKDGIGYESRSAKPTMDEQERRLIAADLARLRWRQNDLQRESSKARVEETKTKAKPQQGQEGER